MTVPWDYIDYMKDEADERAAKEAEFEQMPSTIERLDTEIEGLRERLADLKAAARDVLADFDKRSLTTIGEKAAMENLRNEVSR
jgi:phage host-nuclease inhibitor protein Gam